jgi:hypothetical protein
MSQNTPPSYASVPIQPNKFEIFLDKIEKALKLKSVMLETTLKLQKIKTCLSKIFFLDVKLIAFSPSQNMLLTSYRKFL